MIKISDYEKTIFDCWIRNNQRYKPTAKELGKQPEVIRKVVARVQRKMRTLNN